MLDNAPGDCTYIAKNIEQYELGELRKNVRYRHPKKKCHEALMHRLEIAQAVSKFLYNFLQPLKPNNSYF